MGLTGLSIRGPVAIGLPDLLQTSRASMRVGDMSSKYESRGHISACGEPSSGFNDPGRGGRSWVRKGGTEGSPDVTIPVLPVPHLLSVASKQVLVPWLMPWTCPPSLCPFRPSPSHPNGNVALLFSFNSPVSRCLLTFLDPATNLGHVLEESAQKNRKSVCVLHLLGLSQVQDTLTLGGV